MHKKKAKKTHVGRTETIELTEANIPFISRRSGISEEELEQMRQIREERMMPSKVRYEVVAD